MKTRFNTRIGKLLTYLFVIFGGSTAFRVVEVEVALTEGLRALVDVNLVYVKLCGELVVGSGLSIELFLDLLKLALKLCRLLFEPLDAVCLAACIGDILFVLQILLNLQ